MSREPTTFAGRFFSQFGLSARLLILTVLFVMIAEVLIYVPSVANFRLTWLNDRLAAAQIAAMVLDAAPEESLSEELELRLLHGVGAKAIALKGGGRRSLLATGDVPPEVSKTVDLRDTKWMALVQDAFSALFTPADKPIRVIGAGMGVEFVEMILDQAPLRHAMIEFSRNILFLSLFISIITASLVYLTLQWVIVRPVRRLTGNIAEFSSNPEDASRVIQPTCATCSPRPSSSRTVSTGSATRASSASLPGSSTPSTGPSRSARPPWPMAGRRSRCRRGGSFPWRP